MTLWIGFVSWRAVVLKISGGMAETRNALAVRSELGGVRVLPLPLPLPEPLYYLPKVLHGGGGGGGGRWLRVHSAELDSHTELTGAALFAIYLCRWGCDNQNAGPLKITLYYYDQVEIIAEMNHVFPKQT